jgi:hypothetical protein
MILRLSLAVLFSFIPSLALCAQTTQDKRAADAASIRAHIESIFQAFLDGDVEKIYATHSEDWRGFLDGSRVPIKGVDEYMRANGIEWPHSSDCDQQRRYLRR